MLPQKWANVLEVVDFAFQPIVNPLTGVTFAVEALIRNVEPAGFTLISDFFDLAYQEQVLFSLDLELRRKAIKKFMTIDFYNNIKLFYNYDPRTLEMPNHRFGLTEKILQEFFLTNDVICFELNERFKVNQDEAFKNLLNVLKGRGFKLALDDFGAGFASFELFYYTEPDFLKIDRFLINGIDKDLKKKTFCSQIVSLAKLLGVLVIAEGVETEAELIACRDIGFDFIQGYFIQKPDLNPKMLSYTYFHAIKPLETGGKVSHDVELISKEIVNLDTISVFDDIKILFDKFHKNLQFNFFPVLDRTGFPLGIIHEKNIKKYVYSPYGKDLLSNKSVITSLNMFITKCPIADINTHQERILDIYVNNPDSEGVIITKDQEYFGFLTAKSLLNIVNDKNLAFAREINPLTKLPGNALIHQYIIDAVSNPGSCFYLIYFDFNHFKPFNDKYGFGQGDMAIKLFAETLKKEYQSGNSFIGHIGGDDFFVGLRRNFCSLEEVQTEVKQVIEQFSSLVKTFYTGTEVKNSFYISKDRKGKLTKYPLLSVSAAILEIPIGERNFPYDRISEILASLKKEAKNTGGIVSTSSTFPLAT